MMLSLPQNRPADRMLLPRGAAAHPAVPPFVQWMILRFWEPVSHWLSDLLIADMLAEHPTHPLVLTHRYMNFSAAIDVCHAYRQSNGRGAPATYSVETLLRAEIVRSLFDTASDRDLEYLLKDNRLVRWFVGLPLFPGLTHTPDHTTLSRFHAWLSTHHPGLLHETVLHQLALLDPEDGTTTPQIVDTFAVRADAGDQTIAVRLMRITARLGTLWENATSDWLCQYLPLLDWEALRTARAARRKGDRARQLQHAVRQAQQVITAIQSRLHFLSHEDRAVITEVITLLTKIIVDETTTDATGQVIERPKPAGTHRIISATDPEATLRKHGDETILGYNATIAVTATRIVAATMLTGCEPDQEALLTLLRQEVEHGHPLPEIMIMDQAGGFGKTRARVDAISDGHTSVVARVPQAGGADTSRFVPADFEILARNEDRKPTRVRCPNGVETTRIYRHGGGEGVQVRFTAEVCSGCPLWDRCRDPQAKSDGNRTVFLSDYHPFEREAHQFNATEIGQALLKRRWQVEPVISWLVHYHGCRRARRRGLQAAAGQLLNACAVRNLLMWFARLARGTASLPPCRS